MLYIILVPAFFIAMIVYFRIADHYNIIDHPNERSSHTKITIRGGGIIFMLAAICSVIAHPAYWLPATGILIIGGISFADDILTLSNRIRILFHLIAVSIIFYYLNVFGSRPAYSVVMLYIMAIGIINMYNFMDGINGIMGAYSMVVLGGLQYVNIYRIPFIEPDMIWIPIIACVVFLYFNFRKKAKCFAGDVGSVTMALWIVMLVLRLIFVSSNWMYILFLSVYGIDSVLTIAHRVWLKQNIFKAHRLHFYQFLANEKKISHLLISSGYALLQLIIILLVIFNDTLSLAAVFAVCLIPLILTYVLVKPRLMKWS